VFTSLKTSGNAICDLIDPQCPILSPPMGKEEREWLKVPSRLTRGVWGEGFRKAAHRVKDIYLANPVVFRRSGLLHI
jgi:hypothetical protein